MGKKAKAKDKKEHLHVLIWPSLKKELKQEAEKCDVDMGRQLNYILHERYCNND